MGFRPRGGPLRTVIKPPFFFGIEYRATEPEFESPPRLPEYSRDHTLAHILVLLAELDAHVERLG